VAPNEEYSRAAVRRKFGLSERQLRSWEKQELIAATENYSFSDLISIQTLIKLRENRIQPRQISRALASLRQKLASVKHPLAELRIVLDGKKIAVHVGGQRMEAISGQILFDFDTASLGDLKSFPEGKRAANRLREAESWFQKGLELEETGAPVSQAIEAYLKALELNPDAAGALVNLGTIYYRQRKFPEAEKYYRRAIEADAQYPLAQFNLGNLHDEQGRLPEAVEHYRAALRLNPQYADAHFNLALLCERMGETLRAVHHWKCYLKLDSTGQWAEIARRQLERLRQATVMPGARGQGPGAGD
jgi:tetratricopeptide (TPR) repeat protein